MFSMLRDNVIEWLLKKYLCKYVEDINRNMFKVSLHSGKAELYGLEVRREALDGLQLPIAVKRGLLGHLKLSIPWGNIENVFFRRGRGEKPNKKAVEIIISDIFIIAAPLQVGEREGRERGREGRVVDGRVAGLGGRCWAAEGVRVYGVSGW